jgi:hypothetical protein
MFKKLMVSALVLGAPAFVAMAGPKEDVDSAVKKLNDAGAYAWHTATEGGFASTADGKTQKDGLTSLSQTMRDTTFEVLIKGDKAAVKTDEGWKSAAELQEAEGPQRFLARMATTFKAPAVQAQEIAGKVKELKQDGDAFAGELTEEGAKSLMTLGRGRGGAGGGGQGPQIADAKGTAKFWTKDGALSKMQYTVQGKMTINGEDREINRTTTVDIKDVGSAKVEVPADAKSKLQ